MTASTGARSDAAPNGGPVLRVQRLGPHAQLPARQHTDDAGFDLVAAEPVELAPAGGRAVVGTGVAVELPPGWSGLVCPRSGLAARHGIGVVNGPGVIDEGYRGELRVVLVNHDPAEPFTIARGDRIAQLVLIPTFPGAVEEVAELASAGRSSAGFGSTGGFGTSVGAH